MMHATTDTLLSIRNLVAGYGKLAVLHDVSLDVPKNSMLAVIGPNGAGKSTLMKSIMRLVNIMSGEIAFDGAAIGKLETQSIAAKGISYVPQLGNVFASLSVHENLEMSCNLLPRKEHEGAIEAVYERFPRLRERASQAGRSLSGGERQMLAIGSALISQPRLLILDEPVSGLSPHMTEEVIAGIQKIRESGLAVIWVAEENPQQVIELSDNVCVMGAGTVRVHCPARELAAHGNFRDLLLGL